MKGLIGRKIEIGRTNPSSKYWSGRDHIKFKCISQRILAWGMSRDKEEGMNKTRTRRVRKEKSHSNPSVPDDIKRIELQNVSDYYFISELHTLNILG